MPSETVLCEKEQTAYRVDGIAFVEALMLIEQDHEEPRASAATTPVDHQESAPMPGEGVEPELNALSSGILPVPADSATHGEALLPNKEMALESMFVTQSWHRPYAEALMETDPAELPSLIALAERAILTRYRELKALQVSSDELVDLRHAIEALSQLKKRE